MVSLTVFCYLDPWNNQFGLYNDGTAHGDYPGHYNNHKRGRSTARSLYHPHQMVRETDPTEPPPAPLRNKGSDLEVDNLALEGVAPELAPKYEASPPRHRKESHERDSRRPLVDAFTRRISDFLEDKRRRMPANVKTYDGTGDPDNHLKIFESAAIIENWPQPVWCHMFNSTLVRNARNWFSKLPRRSIDGFEELRRAFRLNFTQRKKCAKNPVELARVKQRQGESTSAYVERYKDECIHVKACPEIIKISGSMNGINNQELIKRLNDRVPQTF
nr:reverse transcriptase domain-containing protein [Tanacetum cinerariifolium]